MEDKIEQRRAYQRAYYQRMKGDARYRARRRQDANRYETKRREVARAARWAGVVETIRRTDTPTAELARELAERYILRERGGKS